MEMATEFRDAMDKTDYGRQYDLLTSSIKDPMRAAAIATEAKHLEADPPRAIDWREIRRRVERGERVRHFFAGFHGIAPPRHTRTILSGALVMAAVFFAFLLQDFWVLQQSEQ